MQFKIKNRFTGAVQFTAEIDCDSGASSAVKIGLAVKWAAITGADLSGAYLSGAVLRGAVLSGAVLSGADLRGADLRDADLRGAYLRGAVLRDTDLSGAYLSGAVLRDADLRDAVLRDTDLRDAVLIHCGARSDGYEFFAHIRNGDLWIKAGCRYFTVADAKAHWANTRSGTQLGDESLQLVANAERLAIIRGLIKAESTK